MEKRTFANGKRFMRKQEKIILFLLAAINFTHILDFMIMMPLGNYLIPHFHITAQQFTVLVSSYSLSAAFSGFMAAFFVDRMDRKKVLLFGYSGFLLGTIACGLAPTYSLLLVSRIVAGLFGGLIAAQILSIISDIFPYENRGKAMGSVMSAFAIASTLGVPFALYLANLIHWHAPFLLVGIMGIALLPLLYRIIPNMTRHIHAPEQKQSPFTALLQLKNDRNMQLALLFNGLINMGHFLIIPFINPFLEFNNGYSRQLTPLIYLSGGIASFIAAHILGRFSDIHGKLKVFTICILLSMPVVIFITHLPVIPFWIVLMLFAFWFAVSTGRGVTGQAMVSNVVPPQYRGSFMSFNSSVQQLGSSMASLLAGYVVVRSSSGKLLHYNQLGAISVGILIACLLLARYLFQKMDQPVRSV